MVANVVSDPLLDLWPDPLGPEPRGIGQVGRGSDGLSLDRRHHDPAETGGLDPPPGPARRGLLPDPRGPVDQLGVRHEGRRSRLWA